MNLSELQRIFSELIRSEDVADYFPIKSAGLRIYRNNYRAQLKAALRDSYPHVRLWLGDLEFDDLVDIHIDRSPPVSWTLDDYGHDFPSTARSIFPDDPEVWELAWLDMAMAQAFVAADEGPIAASDLPKLDWDAAQIIFVPSLRFTEALSNAAEIWSALEGQSVPPPAAVLGGPSAYLVWRRDFTSHFRLVSLLEHQVISALCLSLTFAEACEILRRHVGDGAAIVAAGEMLGRWLSDGLIAKVEAPPIAAAAV